LFFFLGWGGGVRGRRVLTHAIILLLF